MEIENLGSTDGVVEPTKIALIDADTIVYAAACGSEYAEDLLPQEFYSEEEWTDIINHPQYDEKEGCVWIQNTAQAVESSLDRIAEIVGATNTSHAECYFTEGKNFRYKVYDMYKANRTGRTPAGLKRIKEEVLKKVKGEICREYEADDKVVMLKRTQPDKYVMCAVDKDVLNSIKGEHYNYYRSVKYNIDEKWQKTSFVKAKQWPYFQTLMGDSQDNIPGCPGIGKVRAQRILEDLLEPCEMWEAVVKVFKSKKLTIKDAIRDMRLVNMHQLNVDSEVVLWNPPCEVNDDKAK